jgi:hypothetical protein
MVHRYKIGPLVRSEFWPVIRMFESRRGRLREFWHIDQQNIWTVNDAPAGTFLDLEVLGDFSEFLKEFDQGPFGLGYIGLVQEDGTHLVREIADITETLGIWRLTLTTAIPAIPVSSVKRVARARLSRMRSDSFKETWRVTNQGLVGEGEMDIIELLDEKEVTG